VTLYTGIPVTETLHCNRSHRGATPGMLARSSGPAAVLPGGSEGWWWRHRVRGGGCRAVITGDRRRSGGGCGEMAEEWSASEEEVERQRIMVGH
jgi:hypothetical protein